MKKEKNMKRTIITLVATFGLAIQVLYGKTMAEVWIDMPDSLTMYMSKSMRTELVDYVNMNVAATTKNQFGGTTKIDTLTNDYMAVSLSECSRLEMKLLPRNGKEDVICVVRTYFASAAESTMAFYGLDWHPVEDLSMPEVNQTSLVVKPDSMSVDVFEDTKKILSPKMVEMKLSAESPSLELCYSVPNMPEEDKQLIESILVRRKLNWNGVMFK